MIEISGAELLEARRIVGRMLDASVTPRLSLSLRRVARAMEATTRDVIDEERKILRDCGALEDENGFVARDDDPDRLAFKDTDGEAEAVRRQRALYREMVTVDARPLSAAMLEAGGVRLTGREAIVLGDLLEDDLPLTQEHER